MVEVVVQNLEFRYSKKEVFSGLTHTFHAGTFTAILGQNGSGKTTLIQCISRKFKNYNGKIIIDNHELGNYSLEELAQKIAFVPQGQDAIFGTSVFETILLGRLPFMTWAASDVDLVAVDNLIQRFNLEHLSHRHIKEISGGERQKVYIARAVVQQTPIIILDEPITYLDVKHQLEIMNILKELAVSGFNIIMVVHDINLALRYCDAFVFMKDGILQSVNNENEISEPFIEHIFDVKMSKTKIGNQTYFIPAV